MKILVCDSGPIIHLFEIKNLQLLFNIGEIFIPSTVKMEIEKYLDSIPKEFKIVKMDEGEIPEVERIIRIGKMHRGEAEAIIIAKRINAEILLTDDTSARMYAGLLNLEVHGSLGIVLWNYFNEFLDKKDTERILYSFKKSSLWLSESIFQKALSLLE